MSDPSSPVAGWYDDPEIALRLRWWDGRHWTTHTRARLIVESSLASANSSATAEPGAGQTYAYSAPYSWSPGSAPSPVGGVGSGSRSAHELWSSGAYELDDTPELTTTASAWALAATPLVAVLASAAASLLVDFGSAPVIGVIAAGALPILWVIVFVLRDRERLHAWGHLQRASAWWALLGPAGYLSARGTVVNRQSRGRGWWPLAVHLLLLASLVGIGLLQPAMLTVFATPFR